jgi:hypothetical protein
MDGLMPQWQPDSEALVDRLDLPTAALLLQERSLVMRQKIGREFIRLMVPLDSIRHAGIEERTVWIEFDLTEAVTDEQVNPSLFPQSRLTLRLPMRDSQIEAADRFLRGMVEYIALRGPFMPVARARRAVSPIPTGETRREPGPEAQTEHSLEPHTKHSLEPPIVAGPEPRGQYGSEQPEKAGLDARDDTYVRASVTAPDLEGVPVYLPPLRAVPEPVAAPEEYVAVTEVLTSAAPTRDAAKEAEPGRSTWRPVIHIARVEDTPGLLVFADLPQLDEFLEGGVRKPSAATSS